jgi:hypothetical protein
MKETYVILFEKKKTVGKNFEDLSIHMRIIFKYNLRKWYLRIGRHSVLHGISYQCPLSSNSYEFDVHVSRHRDKFLIIIPTRCTNFSNLFFK